MTIEHRDRAPTGAALSDEERTYGRTDPTPQWRGRWYSEASVERIIAARDAAAAGQVADTVRAVCAEGQINADEVDLAERVLAALDAAPPPRREGLSDELKAVMAADERHRAAGPRREADVIVEPDNHHNAALCPYCTPPRREADIAAEALEAVANSIVNGGVEHEDLREAGVSDAAPRGWSTGSVIDAHNSGTVWADWLNARAAALREAGDPT